MMNVDDLKKVLAGFCIASLIAGTTFTLSGCATGSGEKPGAGSSTSG